MMSHTFPTFQQVVYNAIKLEYKHKELGEQKRKATTSGQPSSVSHPRFNPVQGTPLHSQGPSGNFGQNQLQCNNQPFKHPIQQLT
jgi:hypothetical protein